MSKTVINGLLAELREYNAKRKNLGDRNSDLTAVSLHGYACMLFCGCFNSRNKNCSAENGQTQQSRRQAFAHSLRREQVTISFRG